MLEREIAIMSGMCPPILIVVPVAERHMELKLRLDASPSLFNLRL